MTAEVRRLVFAEGVQVLPVANTSIEIGVRSAIVNLVAGEVAKTIVFASPAANANYAPLISFLCDDANPIFPGYVIQNKTINGFTIKLSGPVDSNNYKISYRVSEAI